MNDHILKIIETAEKEKGYNRFGIRAHHEPVKVGDRLESSYNTLDDQDPEELDGICCMGISYDGFDVEDFEGDIKKLIKSYGANNIILVGGICGEYGNDADEIIIADGEVLWAR